MLSSAGRDMEEKYPHEAAFLEKTAGCTAAVAVALGLLGGGAAGVWFWVKPLNYSVWHFIVGVGLGGALVVVGGGVAWGAGPLLAQLAVVLAGAVALVTAGASGAMGGVLAAAWILALAVGLGDWALERVGTARGLGVAGRVTLGAALGLGALAMGVLGLGLVGGLQPALVWGVMLLLSWIVRRRWGGLWGDAKAAWRAAYPRWVANHGALVGFLVPVTVLCLLGAWLWALAPPVWFDELNYQLAAPATYARLGAIVDRPEEFRFLWAHNANMVYTLGILVGGLNAAKPLHFSLGLLAAVAAYTLGRRVAGAPTGALAAVLFLAVPIVSWELGVAYVDLAVTFFLSAALLAALQAARQGELRWAALAGVVGGLAVGTKLNAGFLVLPLGVVLVASLPRRFGWRRALAAGVGMAAGTVVAVAPWLVRDGAWTGNPVFPYLNHIFASPRWALDAGTQNFHLYGHRSVVPAALLLPWDLVVHAGAFGEALGPGTAGALLWLGLPWCVMGRRNAAARWAGVAWGVILPGLLLTLAAAQYLRFLIPVFVPLAVVAAINLREAWRWGVVRWPRPALVAALALGVVYVGGSRLAHAALLWPVPERFPFSVALGLEGREAFLTRVLPEYAALERLDGLAAADAKVVGVGCHGRLYTHARLFEAAWGRHELRELLNRGLRGEALAEALREHGFAAMIVNRRVAAASGWQDLAVLAPEFLAVLGEPVFAGSGLEVYRLHPAAAETRRSSINLLANPGFEEGGEARVIRHWYAYGNPRVGGLERARRGEVAILAGRHDGLTQPVAVREGEVYTLGHWTRADGETQAARLQINWLDGAGTMVGVSIEVVPVGPSWRWHTMTVTAPSGAVTANVYASVHGDSHVWFDDMCLVRGTNVTGCESAP